ncbi:hypothetical protein P4S72_10915 [Vibrio sp. PP-XX7]
MEINRSPPIDRFNPMLGAVSAIFSLKLGSGLSVHQWAYTAEG